MVTSPVASGGNGHPTAGKKPDFGGRAGEVRGDFRICGMLTAATYPEDTVLSRAVSRKFYQEEI